MEHPETLNALKARALEAANESRRSKRLDVSAKYAEAAAQYTVAGEVAALRFALAGLATAAERMTRDIPILISTLTQIRDEQGRTRRVLVCVASSMVLGVLLLAYTLRSN